jgi:hypothetical protein
MDDHHGLGDHGFDDHEHDDVGWQVEPTDFDPDLGTAETHDLFDHTEVAHSDEPETADYDVHEPIGYGDDLSGHDMADITDLSEPLGFGAAFGVDPYADLGLVDEQPFPPMLELDLPDPVDGPPWTDPATLGHDTVADLTAPADPPPVDELFEYAGEQPPLHGDPWTALLGSEDPATSALARWWST